MNNKVKLDYVNSLNEVSWEDKSKHIENITDADVKLISNIIAEKVKIYKEELAEIKSRYVLQGEYSEEHMEDIIISAINDIQGEIDFFSNILHNISKLDSLKENEWHAIFIELIKADSQDLDMYLGLKGQDGSYYEELRDTANRVELVSGILKATTPNLFLTKESVLNA